MAWLGNLKDMFKDTELEGRYSLVCWHISALRVCSSSPGTTPWL